MTKKIQCKFILCILLLYTNVVLPSQEIPKEFKKIQCNIKRLPLSRIPKSISRPLIRSRRGRGNSPNWSGYIAVAQPNNPVKNSVKDVSGSWKVPQLIASNNNGYSAIWVGIDGYGSRSVEQIGTGHDWEGGKQRNFAWFEMYPKPPYEIQGFPLEVGDSISAIVEYVGNYIFKMTLINNTKKIYITIPTQYTTSYTAQRVCAEWIIEPPVTPNGPLPLANYGTVTFNDSMTNINGQPGSINDQRWVNESVTMVSQTGIVKSVPSQLSNDGKSFTLTWKHE